ncbi:pseudouridine synthase [Mycoplasma sp. 4044]
MQNNQSEKLQKFISASGLMSRRKAEEEIQRGMFKINGNVAKLGDRVTKYDAVFYKNKKLVIDKKRVYVLLNKPKYVITSVSDPQNRKTVKDIVNLKEYIYPVGRLDFDTSGIILLTNDGELTNNLLHPSKEVEREYIATLQKPLSDSELNFLNSKDVFIEGKRSLQNVTHIQNNDYSVVLKEGRYHHVKNLFLEVNNKVTSLHRQKFATLTDKGLRVGKWRFLTDQEVNNLKKMIVKK